MSEPTFDDPGDCHQAAGEARLATFAEAMAWAHEPYPPPLIETLIRDGRVTIAGLGQVSIEWSGGKPFGLRIMPSNAVMDRIRSMK